MNKYGVYSTNGHNRPATGTIKAFCYEMNIFTVCSLFWKVKRVLSCVVLIGLASYRLGPISACGVACKWLAYWQWSVLGMGTGKWQMAEGKLKTIVYVIPILDGYDGC